MHFIFLLFRLDRSFSTWCRYSGLLIGFCLLLLFWGPGTCSYNTEREDAIFKAILEKGELVVLTRNAPTTYYFGTDGETGYEYDLVTAYAQHLGVDVRFETRATVDDVLQALAEGKADMAAAGLTLTENRKNDFLFGPPYFKVQQQLVCRRGRKLPGDVEDMKDVSIEVTAASSYVDNLVELANNGLSDLTWRETELTTEQILERVWLGYVDCTLADSNIVSLNRRYMPELLVAFPLAETEDLAWALPPDAHDLKESIHEWFAEVDESISQKLYGRYYAHVEIFDYVDTARFKRRIQTRLPEFREMFEDAGEEYDIDWKLLAAMAYQESHWDPLARSATGVRGMMMLTLRTAGQLGIENRIDARQSIMGGARYFANLYERVPEQVTEPDRTWIALSAYNVGMGHVFDARNLARSKGIDPNSWMEFRKVLPLLSQPQYYQKLRYGYARGSEPVRYVTRIRNYYDIIKNEIGRYEEGPFYEAKSGVFLNPESEMSEELY